VDAELVIDTDPGTGKVCFLCSPLFIGSLPATTPLHTSGNVTHAVFRLPRFGWCQRDDKNARKPLRGTSVFVYPSLADNPEHLQRLQRHFHAPYAKMKRDFPETAVHHPFECVACLSSRRPKLIIPCSIKVKDVKPSYHLEKVFNEDIPKLQHGNDGLIYTPVATPYVTGTDKNMYALLLAHPRCHNTPCMIA
jgi:hypothetical protein